MHKIQGYSEYLSMYVGFIPGKTILRKLLRVDSKARKSAASKGITPEVRDEYAKFLAANFPGSRSRVPARRITAKEIIDIADNPATGIAASRSILGQVTSRRNVDIRNIGSEIRRMKQSDGITHVSAIREGGIIKRLRTDIEMYPVITRIQVDRAVRGFDKGALDSKTVTLKGFRQQ